MTLNKFFFLAWENTSYLSNERMVKGHPCLLSVNAAAKRSQDQLHIHISFLSRDAEKILTELYEFIKTDIWSDTPFAIKNQKLYLKKLTSSTFSSNTYRDTVRIPA
ncbi:MULTISPECIES: CDP-diacylglycerol diphosphatase [unclassified Erwinia]|uniref:CDP-diacylglycerol diphosphatase n=1 Tax=unclassified Erwinia TaxID=2622719 RepID=UPI000C187B54|nr:hypothetical protein BV501_17950 [Erwinia sp. OAMSP11]